MLQNNEKSAEVLKAEKIVEQAKARLAEAKRKASQQKRKEENQHKYMMGGIVHKYFPECYQFDEQELNRIIASGMKSEQCQRIIEIVKKESADKRENAVVKAESEVAGDEGTGKSENAQDQSTRFSRCAQIYHLRWYVRSPRGLADSCCLPKAVKREHCVFPSVQRAHLPICILCVQ